MSTARIRTAVTLAVLAVILVVMVVVGWKSATKSFPSVTGDSKAKTCKKEQVVKRIYRKQITVSVYNASRRKGLADSTMGALERKSFKVGQVGNAPSGTKVRYIAVYAPEKGDPAATLVARQFRPAATVVVTDTDLGPGVEVVLGQRARKPHVPSPQSLELAEPRRTCLDNTG